MHEVDQYITKFPNAIKEKLEQVRSIIKSEAPQLTEGLKWGNLAYSNDTIMFILAGYKNHIGLHVTKTTITVLKDKLTDFETTAGSVQFPVDKPIPAGLVKEILQCRIKEYEKKSILWK
jgi:uncharacterized protein YdhG (YjbR/CyaY superfamily)